MFIIIKFGGDFVNSALLVVIAVVWFYFAYKWYGTKIEKKTVAPNDENKTPAIEQNDGVDYYPAKPFVLFGHHFSSIAGAGPILGPVAAVAAFGWGGTILWIMIGAVFIGAVHDYLSLMISTRSKGNSIPEIAQQVIGKRARNLFSIFVLITLILIVAVFGSVAANTLVSTPEVVIPTFGVIPLAMLFGFMVYRKNISLTIGTVVSLVILALLIYLGFRYPVAAPLEGSNAYAFWFILLMAYGLFASILPVWVLLQPRDYISNWVLMIGLGLGLIGTFVTRPVINAPAFTGFTGSGGPLWPMLFITVACGAISGFHSLVASGTTSKQLAKESDGKLVGFGGMLLEGVLAVLAVICVAAGLYWVAPAGQEAFSFLDVLGEGGAITAFGMGYGKVTEPLLGVFGMLFGITMLKTFVMTTLDTTVRLGRFVSAELIGAKLPFMKNRLAGSLLIIIPAFYLGYTGTYNVIWPMFGAANQLVAALALLVVTAYLVGVKKPTKYTLYPAIFMILTTLAALIYQGYGHFFGSSPNYVLGTTSAVLFVLAIVVAGEAWKILSAAAGKKKNVAA